MAPLPALELQEAEVQDATAQIGFELALDEARQAAVLGEAVAERQPVLGDGLVKNRLFGLAARVVVGTLRAVVVRVGPGPEWVAACATASARGLSTAQTD